MAFIFQNPQTNGNYYFLNPEQVINTPPSFIGGLSATNITTSGLTVNYTLDEDCTSYLIVVAQGSAIPTPEQIKAGVDYGAVTVLFSSNEPASANVADSLAVTGLSAQAGQQVTVYMTAEDGDSNLQEQGAVRSITVTLEAVNNPPTVSGNYPQQIIIIDQSFSFDGSANFSDTDTLTYSITGVTGATINSSTGLVSYTPGVSGSFTATITATDTAGQSVGAQLPLIVVEEADINLRPYNRVVQWQGLKTPNLIIGDNFIHTLTLYCDSPSVVCGVSAASSIKVALVKSDHSEALTGSATLSSSEQGASWSGGVVVINMSQALTAEAASEISMETMAKLEIQVTLAGNVFSWFAPVKVIPGYID